MHYLFLFLLLHLNLVRDSSTKEILIKEIRIYEDIYKGRETILSSTGDLYELQKIGRTFLKGDSRDCEILQSILKDVKPKNKFIGKIGRPTLYALIITEKDQIVKLEISPDIIINYSDSTKKINTIFLKIKKLKNY